MLNVLALLLMAPPAEGSGNQGIYSNLLMILLIVVVFYFFFIRPQMRKNKEIRKFRESIKKGDRVITIGGIHGKILEIQETTIIIEVEGQNRLKIEKSAISLDGSSRLTEEK